MKGQGSFEYVILTGIVLTAMIPLFYYSISNSNENIKINQANDAVNTLIKAADTVYSLGPGARTSVWITIPGGVESISIVGPNNKEILLKLHLSGGSSDIHATSRASLVEGTNGIEPEGIPESKGTYKISLEMLSTNEVKIGD